MTDKNGCGPSVTDRSYPATAAFAARVAFIHSVSHGARMLDVIRQSATKVPLAPASIQSCSAHRSLNERMTAESAPTHGPRR